MLLQIITRGYLQASSIPDNAYCAKTAGDARKWFRWENCTNVYIEVRLACAEMHCAIMTKKKLRAGLTIRGPHTNVRRGFFLVREARIFLSLFPQS